MRKQKAPGGVVGKGGTKSAPVPDDRTVRVAAEQLIMMPIDELVPYASNARTHSKQQITQIRASLREFGFVTPILIDFENNVIAGHGRLEAARAEGMTAVPCVLVSNLTDTQRKAYILADNRLSEISAWDTDLLKIELEGLEALDFSTGLIGFDTEAMKEIHVGEYDRAAPGQGDAGDDTPLTANDDSDAQVPEPCPYKSGDVFKMGRQLLVCGGCTPKGK